jgi:hypothetical protein
MLYIPAFADVEVASSYQLSAISYQRKAEGGLYTMPPANELLMWHLLMFSSCIGPGMEA